MSSNQTSYQRYLPFTHLQFLEQESTIHILPSVVAGYKYSSVVGPHAAHAALLMDVVHHMGSLSYVPSQHQQP